MSVNVEELKTKQVLTYNKEIDGGKLMAELHEAIPALAPTINADGSFTINLRLFTAEDGMLTIWTRAAVDSSIVDFVVESHIAIEPIEQTDEKDGEA
jgi:hypothetical protein